MKDRCRDSLSFAAIFCAVTMGPELAAQTPTSVPTVSYETPFFAVCVPYQLGTEAEPLYFGARTVGGNDEFLIGAIVKDEFLENYRFSNRTPTPLVFPPRFASDSVATYAIVNIIAGNDKHLLLGKIDILTDKEKLFFGRESSIAVSKNKKTSSEPNVFELDLRCQNIFSDDLRFDWLNEKLFLKRRKRK